MEFYNRRLLLLSEDAPISTISPPPLLNDTEPITTTNSSSPPEAMAASSLFRGRPLQSPPRPVFTSNVAYAFTILLTTLFFLGFILLYVRQFAGDTSTAASSRRRRRRRRNSRSPCGGVDPTTVQSLPVFSHHGDTKEQVECAICLDELQKGETVKMIPYCKHLFHPECIDTWLISHLTCPICRCTRFCEVGRGGSIKIHDHHQGGTTVENGGEVGSHNEGRISRSSSDSSLGLRLGDTVMVGLRRTLSC